MSDAFADGLAQLVGFFGDGNSTSTSCPTTINHSKFYQFTLIPAIIICLLLASTKRRRQKLLQFLGGRPGLIFPMDAMTRTSRLSYACAFGATSFLVYQILLEQRFAVDYDGPIALKTLIAILSMFIYGMVFFPVFACLALGTAFSYGLGSLYVWIFLVLDIYKLTECDALDTVGQVIVVVRALPSLVCELYLSISLPLRFGIACYHRNFFTSSMGEKPYDETVEEVRESYQGKHVRALLKKPKIEEPEVGKCNKVKSILLGIVHKVLYKPESGFRYPSRLISVMVVASIVVYVVTVELMVGFVTFLDSVMKENQKALDSIGTEEQEGEDEYITSFRNALLLAYYFTFVSRICVIVSISVACVVSLVNILHMMSSYRTNLYAMYRGDYRNIPSPYEKSAIALCIGSMKYAGFQVGYIVWSFIIVTLILFIVCVVVATIIILLINGITDWLVNKILQIWPGFVLTIAILLTQKLLARFLFLQDKGQHLRLDNRRFFFVFTFFMFFYNIFLGLVSCLLRIIKAIVVGTVFLARLDNSTLPRRFEFLDPGFNAYQGYIHMEAAHTHPVVIVFIRLLAALRKERERESSPQTKVDIDGQAKPDKEVVKHRPVNVAARFNWHVTYTLLHNPAVRLYRKGFIQAMRKARKEGRKLPISDRPYTDFDLVKSDEELEKERQKEADGIAAGLAMMGLGRSSVNSKPGNSSLPTSKPKGKIQKFKGWINKKTSSKEGKNKSFTEEEGERKSFENLAMERRTDEEIKEDKNSKKGEAGRYVVEDQLEDEEPEEWNADIHSNGSAAVIHSDNRKSDKDIITHI